MIKVVFKGVSKQELTKVMISEVARRAAASHGGVRIRLSSRRRSRPHLWLSKVVRRACKPLGMQRRTDARAADLSIARSAASYAFQGVAS